MKLKLSNNAISRIARSIPGEADQIVEHVRAALEELGFESLHDLIKEFKTVVAERDQLLQELGRMQ